MRNKPSSQYRIGQSRAVPRLPFPDHPSRDRGAAREWSGGEARKHIRSPDNETLRPDRARRVSSADTIGAQRDRVIRHRARHGKGEELVDAQPERVGQRAEIAAGREPALLVGDTGLIADEETSARLGERTQRPQSLRRGDEQSGHDDRGVLPQV